MWSFNNTLETVVLQNWSSQEHRNLFVYSPKNETGYGILQCWGRNSIGSQKEPCIFRIVPAGTPEPPFDCVVTNLTSDSLAVECMPGYNGSLPQIFHMEIYNSVAEHMTDNLTSFVKPVFKAKGLTPTTSYVLVVYASNVKGRSNSVALVA
ncbi:Nephrin, partial [Stegodyphus mimosarum]